MALRISHIMMVLRMLCNGMQLAGYWALVFKSRDDQGTN
jgi:hypothetical protein